MQESNSDAIDTSDLLRIKRNMYNARRKLFPALPKNIQEIHDILKTFKVETSKNENFLLLNDEHHNLIIFACSSNLNCLTNSETVYLDGTFTYCTKFFKQLVTLHGFINGHYIPLIFCLLSDKSPLSYERVFKFLVDKCAEMNLIFSPKTVIVDLEKSIHNAVLNVWPETKIECCRFHLTQAWYRKIQELGLSVEYRDDTSEVGKWLHYIFGLVFIDPNEVGNVYVFTLAAIMPPQNKKLETFASYLVNTYIDEEASYPPTMWASASSSTSKTTNACESFHSHFNSSFSSIHPSLFIFINALTDFQNEVYIKMQSYNKQNKLSKNSHTKNKEKIIAQKIKDYTDKQIDTLSFLKSVCSYYYKK